VIRCLVVNKGAGVTSYSNGIRSKTPPAYRTQKQVKALIKYCIGKNKKTERDRLVMVIDGGLGLGLEGNELLTVKDVDLVTDLLIRDVPEGRRKVRHVILPFHTDLPIEEQVLIAREFCPAFMEREAPGHPYAAFGHDDHVGEDGRGIESHLIITNAGKDGEAIDWSLDDLERQLKMDWATELGVVSGRKVKSIGPRKKRLPYPKSKV
jgi:hypothetical protein